MHAVNTLDNQGLKVHHSNVISVASAEEQSMNTRRSATANDPFYLYSDSTQNIVLWGF